MINKIKRKLDKVEADEMYSPEAIKELGLILDSNLKPSRFRVYSLIRNGKLKSVNLGSGSNPKYFVKGKDLKEYVRKILQLG